MYYCVYNPRTLKKKKILHPIYHLNITSYVSFLPATHFSGEQKLEPAPLQIIWTCLRFAQSRRRFSLPPLRCFSLRLHLAWRRLVGTISFDFLVFPTKTACFRSVSLDHLHYRSHFSRTCPNCLSEVVVKGQVASSSLSPLSYTF